jgi:hypothetical protein
VVGFGAWGAGFQEETPRTWPLRVLLDNRVTPLCWCCFAALLFGGFGVEGLSCPRVRNY